MYIWAKKLTALSFIGLIVLGNIWLMSMFTGEDVPSWTAYAFFFFLVTSVLGFIGMLPEWIRNRQIKQE